MNDDFETLLGKTEASSDQLTALGVVAQQALDIKAHIDMLKEAQKAANEELHALLSKTLPDMISGAGLSEFTLKGGATIQLKEYVSGSLPKDDEARETALEWIRDHGGETLLKTKVVAEFGKGTGNQVAATLAALRDLDVDFSAREDIHPQTLYAWARERLRAGQPVAFETLGLEAGRMAKITEGK